MFQTRLQLSLICLCACGKIPDNAWPVSVSDRPDNSTSADEPSSNAADDSSSASSDNLPGEGTAVTAGHIEEQEAIDPTSSPEDETNGETGDSSTDSSSTTNPSNTTSSGSTSEDSNDTSTGNNNDEISLTYLSIQPPNVVLQGDLNIPIAQHFSALGFYSDGSSRDLSDQVHWRTDNSAFGSFNGSKLQVSPSSSTGVRSIRISAASNTNDSIQGTAQVTVANYRKSGPDPELLFILPYQDPKGAQSRKIRFQTIVQSLDVFFAIDTTASMGGEIDQLQESISRNIIPQLRLLIPNSQFGLGTMQDYPLESYGAPGDQPFRLLQKIGPDPQKVQKAVDTLTLGNGYDHPEATIEALYQIASGDGLSAPPPAYVAENHEGKGGVGFRPSSLPVIVAITDAFSHAPGESNCPNMNYAGPTAIHAHTRQQTIEALTGICAKVIGIASSQQSKDSCSARADGEQFARTTRSRVHPASWDRLPRPKNCKTGQCCTGIDGTGLPPDEDGMCPLVFDINPSGEGLGQSIVAGLQALVEFAPFDVVAEIQGISASNSDLLPDFDLSTTQFIKSVVANHLDDIPVDQLPRPRRNGNSIEGVFPGMTVEFSLSAFNDIVEATSTPQVYQARMNIFADRCTQVSVGKRNLVIVVPPKPYVPQ